MENLAISLTLLYFSLNCWQVLKTFSKIAGLKNYIVKEKSQYNLKLLST